MFNPKIGEGGNSAVTTKAPVKGPNIAGAVAGILEGGATIFKDSKLAEVKASSNANISAFTEKLNTLSMGVQAGTMNQATAARESRNLYSKAVMYDGGNISEYTKAYKNISSVTGAFEDKASDQEKLRDMALKTGENLGIIGANSTEEEIQVGLQMIPKFLNSKAVLEQKKREREERIGSKKEQSDLEKEQNKIVTNNAVKDYVAGSEMAGTREMNDIYNNAQGGTDASIAVIQLKDLGTKYKQDLIELAGPEGSDYAVAMADNFQRKIDVRIAQLTGNASTEQAENQIKKINLQNQNALLQDPEFGALVAASQLTNNAVAIQLKLESATARVLAKLGTEGKGNRSSVPSLLEVENGDKVLDNLGNIVTETLKTSDAGEGNPEEAVKQVSLTIDNIAKSIINSGGNVDGYYSAKDYKSLMNFYASDGAGEVFERGLANPEFSAGVAQTLKDNYENTLMPLVKKELLDTFETHRSRGWMGGNSENINDIVDVEFTGAGMRYIPKAGVNLGESQHREYLSMIKNLNKKVAGPVNQNFKVQYRLTGGQGDVSQFYVDAYENTIGQFYPQQPVDQNKVTPDGNLSNSLMARGEQSGLNTIVDNSPLGLIQKATRAWGDYEDEKLKEIRGDETIKSMNTQLKESGVKYEDGFYTDGNTYFSVVGGEIIAVETND